MLSRISVEKYRAFDSFRMEDLARVNLLVGKNNAGKSSLLEAVQLIATPYALVSLSNIAAQRGEVVFSEDDMIRTPSRGTNLDLTHFFHDHKFEIGVNFSLVSNTASLRATIINNADIEKQPRLFDEYSDFALSLQIDSAFDGVKSIIEFPVSVDGGFDSHYVSRAYQKERFTRDYHVQSISPSSLAPAAMRSMWDQVIEEGQEKSVIDALRIIDPKVNSVVFLAADRSYRSSRTGVMLGFEHQKRRYPLGSHGEGTRRMLALALALARTADGTLLIDEIDTGLHWSVMADMWRLVIETARVNDTQVFATTHSLDCVRGLSEACRLYPELSELISVQTIDRELDHSISSTAEDLYISINQEIEVRG